MTDRERAAALADYIRAHGDVPLRSDGFDEATPKKADVDLIEKALRAYAAPAVSADLRKNVARALYGLRARVDEFDGEYDIHQYQIAEFGRSQIGSVRRALEDADAALATISAAGYVIRPREPTEAMIDALISALDVQAGYQTDHFVKNYSEAEKASARKWYRVPLEAALAALATGAGHEA